VSVVELSTGAHSFPFLSGASFLFLIPVQNYINSVTLKRNPNQRKYGWSSGHIVCIVFGCIVWAALLMGGMEEM
jgi:hypothetical protein